MDVVVFVGRIVSIYLNVPGSFLDFYFQYIYMKIGLGEERVDVLK